MNIPSDMIVEGSNEQTGTLVSIRDLMILLGSSDEELREKDRIDALRKEILERDPWRDKTYFEHIGDSPYGFVRGEIDWSGTELDDQKRRED